MQFLWIGGYGVEYIGKATESQNVNLQQNFKRQNHFRQLVEVKDLCAIQTKNVSKNDIILYLQIKLLLVKWVQKMVLISIMTLFIQGYCQSKLICKRDNTFIIFMDIGKIISEGTYKTLVQFNKDDDNLRALIFYCFKMEPSQQSIAKTCSLIKFYRLPIIISFRYLYQKYRALDPQTIKQETRTILEDIAAWVSSLLKKLQIEIFEQIKFIFHWGKAKKKYNIQVFPHEIEFANYISQLSKRRERIKQKLQKNEDVQQETKLLQNFTTSQNLLYLEKVFVDYIKQKVVVEVNQKIFKMKNKEKVKQEIQSIKKNQKPLVIQSNPQSQKQQQESLIVQEKKSLEKTIKKNEQKKVPEYNHFGYEQLPYEQERNLPICCRSYFLQDEVIEQAENEMIEYKFYRYPFLDQRDQKVTKVQKIKRTLCGFLNNKGGTIYFGVKQHQFTKKRQIYGYDLTEKYKSQFEQDIFDLLKDILPEIQIDCIIKWVPIKNKNKNQFIPGRYIAKVIIEKGAKDQVYSYIHDRVQKFVFKTQNQFLLIRDPQKVLKFFRNKLQNPEIRVYKLHNHPCREPLRGKPIYKSSQKIVSGRILPPQYASLQEVDYSRQIQTEKKKFIEKESIKYLIRGYSTENLKIQMGRRNINYKLLFQIQPRDLVIEIYKPEHLVILKMDGFQIYQIYTQVKCQIEEDQVGLFNNIIHGMQEAYNCTFNKKKKYVVDCLSQQISARFWIKAKEMGFQVFFEPASTGKK